MQVLILELKKFYHLLGPCTRSGM